MNKPRVNSDGQKELAKAQEQFTSFENAIKAHDPFGKAPVKEEDPQTEMSSKEEKKYDAPYIKPIRSIGRSKGGKDNAKTYFLDEHKPLHEKDWEYVKCVVENYEIPGEEIHTWTSKWGCDPAHEWKVPVNKPIWIPRLLAEQLSKCKYHRLSMDSTAYSANRAGTMYGTMIADEVKHRIDCRPVGFGF